MSFEITSNFAALLKSKGLMHKLNVSFNRPVQVKFNSDYTYVNLEQGKYNCKLNL